jgi:serine/threonine-protein kinase
MKGTIAYMSPEQLRRRELDRRADVFAAGAVLYEMFTGERLFRGRDEADILIGVLADDIPSVRAKSPDLSADVDSVVSRALARERDERFPNARAFGEQLEKAVVPASATEVAAFVERFGSSEFARRREAIRTFVDHQGTEAFTSEVRPDVPTVAPPNVPQNARSSGWRVATPVGIAILSVMTMAVVLSRSSSVVSNEVVGNAPASAQHVESAAHLSPVDALSAVSSAHVPPSVASSLSQSPVDSPAQQSPAPSARRIVPIREKVDKRRPSELQENPYR